jgi:fructoselysine and glucoselysine-specific PTS system IID component
MTSNVKTKNKIDENQSSKTHLNKIEKRDLRRVLWRSLQNSFSWGYERQSNMAYAYSMMPVLTKLYKKKEDLSKAIKRHLEFFNTTPHLLSFILGISVAMEEKNAENENFDEDTINSVKASLMGPLAGIGDTFFWGTLKLIATGIGTSLAMQGNILGPILFLLIFNIPTFAIRILAIGWGYKLGTGFLQQLEKKGAMGTLTIGASILGLMVVGGMCASLISINIPLTIGSGKSATHVQDILNNIMPSLLPLGSFGLIYWLLGKNVKATTILIGITIVSILGALTGVFA